MEFKEILLLPWGLVFVQDCRVLFTIKRRNYRACVSVKEVTGHRKVVIDKITAC